MKQTKCSLILAPAGVFLLLSAVYLLCGLFPYGENTMAWGDMTQQVIPLLLELKQMLLGGDGLSFSHLTAGGMNFVGVILFFMASPFSLLALLIPDIQLIVWVNVLVMAKLMLCGFCAQWFFFKKFPKLSGGLSAVLGISYAMCGYALLFFQNMIWLDFMALFPLLLLALDRLLVRSRPMAFIFVLSGMLIINLYLSYMLILFLVLFCGFYLFFFSEIEKKNRGRAAFLLGISVLLAALLTAPAWLSFWRQYLNSARGVDLITSLSGGNFFADIRTTFCILLPCPLLIAGAIFPAPDYPKKRRLFLWLLLLMAVPLCIDPVNRMWHTGSYQAFPARYGYITVMMGLVLAAMMLSSYQGAPKYSRRKVLYLCWGTMAFYLLTVIGVLVFLDKDLKQYVRSLWVNDGQFVSILLVFVAGFLCVFVTLFCWQNQWLTRRTLALLLCASTLTGGFFYSDVFLGQAARSPQSWQLAADLAGRIDDTGYYRVKMENKDFDINLLGGIGYNNLGHYTSLTSEEYLFGMKKLGYSCYWMETSPVGGTVLTDALLCNRYIIERTGSEEEGELLYINEKYQIRALSDTLPLGIVTNSGLSEQLTDGTRSEVQQQLFQEIFQSEEQLITSYEPAEQQNISVERTSGHYRLQRGEGSNPSGLMWSIPVTQRQALYFDCFDALSTKLTEPINGAFTVSVNGEELIQGYPSKSKNGLLYLGTFENETVQVQVTLHKDVEAKSFGVYGMDLPLLASQLQSRKTADLTVRGGSIQGTCESSGEEWLFLSVPYDKGFSAKVNGSEAEIYRVFDTFMAVPLQDGENVIQIEYQTPGAKAGLLLCLAGILGVALLGIFKRIKIPAMFEKAAVFLLGGMALLILAVVYLAPVLLWVKAHFLIS